MSVKFHRYAQARDWIGKHAVDFPDICLYNPIVQWHDCALCNRLPTDAAWWKARNDKMISVCDELWVLELPGWETSAGVRDEIQVAETFFKPISYVPYNEKLSKLA